MSEQTNKLIGREFRIQPEDIDASGHLWEAFDHGETEASAGWLVRFCQARGTGWAPRPHAEKLNTHIIGCPKPRGEGECNCAELSKQWGAAIRQYEGQV